MKDETPETAGDELPAKQPVLPWADIRARLEAPARPLYTAAGVALLGHAVAESTMTPLGPVMAGAVLVPVARRLAARWVRFKAPATARAGAFKVLFGPTGGLQRRKTKPARQARRARAAAYTTAGAFGWLALAAGLGTEPATLGGALTWSAFAAAAPLAAAPYWRYARRRPAPEPAPEPEHVQVLDGRPDAAKLKWAEHVASQRSGGAPDTELDTATWREVLGGWSVEIVALRPGAVDVESLTGKNTVRIIADTFQVATGAVNIVAVGETPTRALLLIQPESPLKEGRVWLGPESVDARTGIAVGGRKTDGSPLRERLWRPGIGPVNKIVLGTTGSGKSEAIRRELAIHRWCAVTDPATGAKRGLYIDFLHDPKILESYGEVQGPGGLFAIGVTVDDAHIMIDALNREAERRYWTISSRQWVDSRGRPRAGSVPWDIFTDGPILSSIWDEFHMLAKIKEFIAKFSELARLQRAAWGKSTVASHLAVFGDLGDRGLRDMVTSGRAEIYRTQDGLTSLATGGKLSMDPRQLPRLAGYVLCADGEEETQVARTDWLPRGEEPGNMYDWFFDDANNPIGYPAVVPPETAEAFGEEFMQWAATPLHERARRRNRTNSTTKTVTAADARAGTAKDGLVRILYRADGPMHRDDITGHTMWTWGQDSFSKASKELIDGGDVERVGKGVYGLTADCRGRMDEQFAAPIEEEDGETGE